MEWQSSFLTQKCYLQKNHNTAEIWSGKKTAAENKNLPQSLSWP